MIPQKARLPGDGIGHNRVVQSEIVESVGIVIAPTLDRIRDGAANSPRCFINKAGDGISHYILRMQCEVFQCEVSLKETAARCKRNILGKVHPFAVLGMSLF